MPGSIYTRLAEVANEQYGFVTPDDARNLGVHPMNLVRMAERAQIERRGTGLYRFPLTPVTRLDPYMEATLWPRGVRGVLSHETALELYELSDVHPARIHITVPSGHRVRRQVPRGYRLHHEDLEPDQAERWLPSSTGKGARLGRERRFDDRIVGEPVGLGPKLQILGV